MRACLLVSLALSLMPAAASAEAPKVRVSVLPDRVLIEKGKFDQRLNFDLFVENTTTDRLELSGIEVDVLTSGGALVAQRRVGRNGESHLTIPNRIVEPGGKLVVFNPFHSFELDIDLSTLHFELTFDVGEQTDRYKAELVVRPVVYDTKTDLVLPVAGRLLIHDGHDFYSHHRRLDITGGMTTALGIRTNFLRYAYDFCVVDDRGKLHKGTGEKIEDWYGFGTPIFAPGAGKVVAALGSVPDKAPGERFDMTMEGFLKNPMLPFGNYLIVDHGNGEYSVFAHLKNGSVTLSPGQSVRQGEKIAEMGFSGDAFLVHLHYQLQSDARFGEGLPSYFRDFDRRVGERSVRVKRGQVDSGDVVESRARYR